MELSSKRTCMDAYQSMGMLCFSKRFDRMCCGNADVPSIHMKNQEEIRKTPDPSRVRGFLYGRSVGIRTPGLLDPNQARYQTSPHPETFLIILERRRNVKRYAQEFLRISFEPLP